MIYSGKCSVSETVRWIIQYHSMRSTVKCPNHITDILFYRDAWNKLGSLEAEVAMDQYVDELKKVSLNSL